jgi:hypothetical protein
MANIEFYNQQMHKTENSINNICKLSKCKYIKTCIRTKELKINCYDEIKRGN